MSIIGLARGLAFCVTVPFAVVAVTPLGWAWAIRGGAGVANGILAGAGMILQVVCPVVAVWLLLLRRHTGVAVMLVVQGLAWMAAGWDRHREEFVEYAVVIAIASVLVGVLVAIAPDRRAAPAGPSTAEPPG